MIPILTNLNELPVELNGSCAAVGNFDGVHCGHARLVQELVRQAQGLGVPALVLTFDPPPIVLLQPEVPLLPPITSLERRAELLCRLGVRALIAMPTSPDLLSLSPTQFFDEVLVRRLGIRGMVEGPNFRFGKDREGDTKLLARLCAQQGMSFSVVDAQTDGAGMISSSRIRRLLAEGEIEAANQMLTQPFRITGTVSTGAGRGTKLLVPTANLTQIHSLVPAHGVYGGLVEINGQRYRAAVNIGPNPTFADSDSKVEVHLLQWQGQLYGESLNCDLIIRVRPVKKFASKEELLAQIQADIRQIADRIPPPK
jgi:riboflavin kinase / FMN adenylyltransferase